MRMPRSSQSWHSLERGPAIGVSNWAVNDVLGRGRHTLLLTSEELDSEALEECDTV
jgi:hypothetical protein